MNSQEAWVRGAGIDIPVSANNESFPFRSEGRGPQGKGPRNREWGMDEGGEEEGGLLQWKAIIHSSVQRPGTVQSEHSHLSSIILNFLFDLTTGYLLYLHFWSFLCCVIAIKLATFPPKVQFWHDLHKYRWWISPNTHIMSFSFISGLLGAHVRMAHKLNILFVALSTEILHILWQLST